MRLSPQQTLTIRALATELAGSAARVWLFGSRVHDDARGGDVDLLLEVDTPVEEPALLSARLAAKVSRSMDGRKVDVVIKAPNLLHQPIHSAALAHGVLL